MSFDSEFYVLKDGQIYPTDQGFAETDLSAFCKEEIEKPIQRVLGLLQELQRGAEQTAVQINASRKGFFIAKAEKEETYAALCDFFLELEASKVGLMDEAVGLAELSGRLFEALWLSGEEDSERTEFARKVAMICDGLMLFCSNTAERLCQAIGQAADFEHECAGVRVADTAQCLHNFSEAIRGLENLIKGD